MRMTLGSVCRNTGLAAAVYFLYVGFQKGFDVFGWYGVGWSWGDWLVLALLTGFFAAILFGEWWQARTRARAKAHEQHNDYE